MKPPLKGEGNRRQTVEGFLWNLLHSVKGLRDNPSVTCGDSSPKGEPIKNPRNILPSTPAKCNALHDF